MDLGRLARMDVDEISWRAKAAARIALDRLRLSRTPTAWDRRELTPALAADHSLDAIRSALTHGDWDSAHRALGLHIAFTPQRFALAASNHSTLAPKIRDRFPVAVVQATARAESLLGGHYDLLGYRGLAFPHGRHAVDWHLDPV